MRIHFNFSTHTLVNEGILELDSRIFSGRIKSKFALFSLPLTLDYANLDGNYSGGYVFGPLGQDKTNKNGGQPKCGSCVGNKETGSLVRCVVVRLKCRNVCPVTHRFKSVI